MLVELENKLSLVVLELERIKNIRNEQENKI